MAGKERQNSFVENLAKPSDDRITQRETVVVIERFEARDVQKCCQTILPDDSCFQLGTDRPVAGQAGKGVGIGSKIQGTTSRLGVIT
jgi:hypothetical protein